MISLLRGKGYKLTTNETLSNREFREVSKSYAINEDESTFDDLAYDLTEVFELYLDKKLYSEAKMKAIIIATRDEGIDELSVEVETQERGYLITFTTIKEGVI